MVKTQLAVLAALSLVPALQAQVIQVETREVPVDVTITGRKPGRADLTAKDFSVWEDGKPQKINSVTTAGAGSDTSLKHFVLYFDFTTMPPSDQAASEKAAIDFINGMASPDRYMAVAANGPSGARVLQDFTAAPAPLKDAVTKLPSGFANRAGSNAIEPLVDSLSAVCQSLAPAPGRKALLLFTAGYVDNRGAIPEAIRTPLAPCNRSNAAIYVVAGNGIGSSNLSPQRMPQVPVPNGVLQPTVQDVAAQFAQILADGTGGQSFSLSNSLKEQLASVAREQDDYYRLFYTPPASKEGACHALRVAVNERGLGARARNQYCTEKQVDLVAGKIAGQALESQASGAPNALSATMQLPYFYTGTNRAVVHLAVSLAPGGKPEVDIVGTVTRPDGGVTARFADSVHADHSPYRYEQQFTVPAGTYDFQLAIGAGPGVVGKVAASLKIDPWNAHTLGIGGIAFSTETYPIDPASAGAAPILEGQGPLVAGGRRFVPSATNRFGRSDHIYFYTEVYNPAQDSSGLRMQYRVLDQKTGEVRADTGFNGVSGFVHPGNPVVPFATRLSVAQLPPGAYRLNVRAIASPDQQPVERMIDFELN